MCSMHTLLIYLNNLSGSKCKYFLSWFVDEKVDVESKPLSGVSRLTDTSDENNVDQ